jgi:hypothetical protein
MIAIMNCKGYGRKLSQHLCIRLRGVKAGEGMGRIIRASTEMLPNIGLKRHHHHTGLFDGFGEIVKRSLRTDLQCANFIPHTGTAIIFCGCYVILRGTRLRHYPTSRKVAGSTPDEVDFSIGLIFPAALWP